MNANENDHASFIYFYYYYSFLPNEVMIKSSNNINECEIIPSAPSIPSHITSHSRSKYKPAEDCEWEDLQWQTVQFNLPREYSHPHTNANEIKSRISTCIHGICTEQLDKVSRRVALSSINTPERERVQLISAVWCAQKFHKLSFIYRHHRKSQCES